MNEEGTRRFYASVGDGIYKARAWSARNGNYSVKEVATTAVELFARSKGAGLVREGSWED